MGEILMPKPVDWSNLPPNFDPAAANNQKMGNASLDNGRCTLSRMPLATVDTSPATAVRITQVTTDVLRNTAPLVRVTQVTADVLRNVASVVRVTQVAVEVLRSTAFGINFTGTGTTGVKIGSVGSEIKRQWFAKSASSTFLVGAGCNAVQAFSVSAATGLQLQNAPTGKKVSVYLVNATTGIDMRHTVAKIKIAVASATTGISLGQRARDAQNPSLFASATTGLVIGSAGDRFAFRTYFVNAETLFYCGITGSNVRDLVKSAATSFDIGSSGSGRLPIVFASATTGLNIGMPVFGNVPKVYLASATTGLAVLNTNVVSNTSKYVTATTRVNLGHVTTKLKLGPIFVTATTRLSLKNTIVKAMNFALRVQATTSMDFLAQPVVADMNLAIRVSASTRVNVGLATHATASRAYFVSASSQVNVGLTARQVRNLFSSGATAFAVGAGAVSNGRDIHVSATTRLDCGLVDRSNGFFAKNVSPHGFEVLVMATASVSGTPADTGLVFLHRADAEVWLPWRRNSLSLPPGGQLPH